MGPKFWELILVLAIVVLLFGPQRLAGAGEALGKGIREFREAISSDDAARRQESARVNKDS